MAHSIRSGPSRFVARGPKAAGCRPTAVDDLGPNSGCWLSDCHAIEVAAADSRRQRLNVADRRKADIADRKGGSWGWGRRSRCRGRSNGQVSRKPDELPEFD